MAVIATFLVWVGTEAAKAAGKAIAGAVVSKLVDIPVNAALGIEVRGATLEAWGERGKMIVLAAFTYGKVVPEPSFEHAPQQQPRRAASRRRYSSDAGARRLNFESESGHQVRVQQTVKQVLARLAPHGQAPRRVRARSESALH